MATGLRAKQMLPADPAAPALRPRAVRRTLPQLGAGAGALGEIEAASAVPAMAPNERPISSPTGEADAAAGPELGIE